MKKKVYFILLLVSISVSLSLISTTYSRYVAGANGNIDVSLAKWQILVNNQDIVDGTNSEMEITPVIEENKNIKNNHIAPSSKGYFDINIDTSNVDVSYSYDLTITTDNEEINNLLISKYAILPKTYNEGDKLEFTTITDGKISNDVLFDNSDPSFKFEPFTIRIYFEWYDNGSDDVDTSISKNIDSYKIKVNMNFKQFIEN